MRNLKKFLAVLVVVAMIASSLFTMTAFGAADASMTPTDKAVGLGLIQGGADGVTDEYLNTDTQRIQTAIIYLRLLGLEDKAKAYTATTDNFADADLVKDVPGAVNLLAYLKANPQLGWVGDGTNFHPTDPVSGKALYKVMLTSLGYTQGLDFDYDDTIGFARAKGFALAAYVGTSDAVSNSAMVAALMEAVDLPLNGKTTTLAQNLVDTKVITADAASKYTGYTVAPVGPFAISSITSDNLKAVTVKFNQPVDPTNGANTAFYTVVDGSGVATAPDAVALASDNMSAVLTMHTAIAQSGKVTVTVLAAAISATATADVSATSGALTDTTMPTVKSVTVTGNKLLVITYSEPMKGVSGGSGSGYIGNYTIDGSVYSSNAPVVSADGLTTTINLAQRMAAGTHNVVVNTAVTDYAGIPVAPNTTAVSVAADTTAPAKVTLNGNAGQKEVVVNFDKGIDTIGSVTANGLTGTATIDGTDKTKVTIDFPAPYLPASTSIITFTNVMDFSGNVAATMTLTVTPVVDITRPAVVSITQNDDHSFIVLYNKTVNLNGTYTFKDKDGNVIGISIGAAPLVTSDLGVVNKAKVLVTLTGGVKIDPTVAPYSLAITGVTDDSVLNNVFIDNTITGITFKDLTAPTVAASNAPNAHQLYVTFSEKVDAASATTATNYSLITSAPAVTSLPSDATLTLQSDGMTVLIATPAASANVFTAATATYINFAGIKDLAQNVITTSSFLNTFVPSAAVGFGTPGSVKVTGANTITVQLTGSTLNTGSLVPYDFTIWNGKDSIVATTATYDATTNIVTLTTAQTLNANGTYTGTITGPVQVYTVTSPLTTNLYGTQLSPVATPGITALDACAPSRDTATAMTAAYATAATLKVKVALNEAVVLNAGVNDSTDLLKGQLAVNVNGTLRSATLSIDPAAPKVLILTVDGTSADINYNCTVTWSPGAGATLTDNAVDKNGAPAPNKLNAFTTAAFVTPN